MTEPETVTVGLTVAPGLAAPPEIQLERIVARDALPEDQAQARIDSQLPIDEKASLADVVIDNSSDWDETANQVRKLYAEWANGRLESPR